jgi:hypothetical protein
MHPKARKPEIDEFAILLERGRKSLHTVRDAEELFGRVS